MDDMTYPADAVEAFKNVYRRSVAWTTGNKRTEPLNDFALEKALAAFDAAMAAKGWKRCPRVATGEMKVAGSICKNAHKLAKTNFRNGVPDIWRVMWDEAPAMYGAAPEVKP